MYFNQLYRERIRRFRMAGEVELADAMTRVLAKDMRHYEADVALIDAYNLQVTLPSIGGYHDKVVKHLKSLGEEVNSLVLENKYREWLAVSYFTMTMSHVSIDKEVQHLKSLLTLALPMQYRGIPTGWVQYQLDQRGVLQTAAYMPDDSLNRWVPYDKHSKKLELLQVRHELIEYVCLVARLVREVNVTAIALHRVPEQGYYRGRESLRYPYQVGKDEQWYFWDAENNHVNPDWFEQIKHIALVNEERYRDILNIGYQILHLMSRYNKLIPCDQTAPLKSFTRWVMYYYLVYPMYCILSDPTLMRIPESSPDYERYESLLLSFTAAYNVIGVGAKEWYPVVYNYPGWSTTQGYFYYESNRSNTMKWISNIQQQYHAVLTSYYQHPAIPPVLYTLENAKKYNRSLR